MIPDKEIPVPLPVVISKEGGWFVACCPLLDIATQGKDEEEVKENMEQLVEDYFQDPDTPKPKFEALMTTSISIMNIPVMIGDSYGRKASPVKSG